MQTKTKRQLKIAVIVLIALAILVSMIFAGLGIARAVKISNIEQVEYNGEKLNVILMIGDGMGFNHLKTAEAIYGDLFMNTATVKGQVTTYSRNITKPTDSAASATALATGIKTYNGNIGEYMGKALTSTSEIAKSLDMAVGIIATEGVDGATPSGFSAHTNSRNNLDEILNDQLASNIDVFIGSNIARYESKKTMIEDAGYYFADSMDNLDMSQNKIFASFEEIPLEDGGITKPTLASLATMTMQKLNQNTNGFFMMIEESHIDKCSHNNDVIGAMSHVKAYDNAIKAVVEYAEEIGNTIVIVTADHETGGLQYNGESKDNINDNMYTLTSHSGANVPYFVFGNVDYDFADIMDNTQIAMLCQAIISAGA